VSIFRSLTDKYKIIFFMILTFSFVAVFLT